MIYFIIIKIILINMKNRIFFIHGRFQGRFHVKFLLFLYRGTIEFDYSQILKEFFLFD